MNQWFAHNQTPAQSRRARASAPVRRKNRTTDISARSSLNWRRESSSIHKQGVATAFAVNLLLQPFAQAAKTLVRAWNHLDADHAAHLRGSGGAGVGGGLDCGNIAPEKGGDVTAADFFPADELDVGGFKGRVSRFEQRAKPFC